MPEPVFTVVISTYDRGHHIAPTLQSLRDQSFTDFEALIVDDGSPSPPADALPDDARFRLIALDGNSGSQSRPNNAGIAAARGEYIAYLGHDDIWMPDHLARLAAVFADRAADIAISGCAYHGPGGTGIIWITGLFDDRTDPTTHFFPPSALAHRRTVAEALGGWRSPQDIRPPVDADFLLRAAEAGMTFASTGALTVHKFAAGHRYLSYLEQTSDEQRAFLGDIRAHVVTDETCADFVATSRAAGTFMVLRQPDFSTYEPGQIFRTNRANKGIDRPALRPLHETCEIGVTGEPRALDWYPPESSFRGQPILRWSGPSLRPKLLIPFTGGGVAEVTLKLDGAYDTAHLHDLRLSCRSNDIAYVRQSAGKIISLTCRVQLAPDAPTVLEFILSGAYSPAKTSRRHAGRKLGLPMLGYRIAPVAQ